MSAGNFVLSKYEANSGNIYPVRLQQETIDASIGSANSPPAGNVDQEVSARAGGSRRAIGMNCRTVTVRFTANPPAGYAENQTYRIPILTAARWNGITKGQSGTYLATACIVVGKQPENPV
jgi:hypothetical protein